MNLKYIKNISIYLVIVLLSITYLYILYCGTKPNVAEEYRLYYIENTIPEHLPEGSLNYNYGDNLVVNDGEKVNICKRGVGWGNIEGDGVWTIYEESYVNFVLPEKRAIRMFINVIAMPSDDISVDVYANNHQVYTITKESIGENEIDIAEEYIDNNHLEVRFELKNGGGSSERDSRNLGIKINTLYLEKQE